MLASLSGRNADAADWGNAALSKSLGNSELTEYTKTAAVFSAS